MEKLLAVIFCAALLWNIFADERQIPNWVDTGFKTKENEGKYYWNGDIEEEGIFFSGCGKSEFAADLDGVTRICIYMNQTISYYDDESSESTTVCADPSDFVRTVDKYVADDGTVYVLVFISNADIKNLLNQKESDGIDSRIEIIQTYDENKFAREIKFIEIINHERN